MKILFVYPNVSKARGVQLGIASLSASLKQKGHKVGLFDITFIKENNIFEEFHKMIAGFGPDMVAVSCRSNEWEFAKQLFKRIADFPAIKVIGGPYPTVSPNTVLTDSLVDIIIAGEGEEALIELVGRLENKAPFSDVSNVWLNSNGHFKFNDLGPLIDNLDQLPFPDFAIFDQRQMIQTDFGRYKNVGLFELSRGCPYTCSYCINPYLQKLYQGKGRYHREKSVDRIISEISYQKTKHSLEYVKFIDETFLLDIKKLEVFCQEYKTKIHLPFTVMIRPEVITDEKIRLLKEAGIDYISIGIESGNEQFRKDILHRYYTQDQLINAFEVCKKHGVRTHSFNMVGLPFETFEDMKSTFRINQKVKPDSIQVSIFYPFECTELLEVCKKNDLLDSDHKTPLNYYEESVLKSPSMLHKKIIRARYLIPFFYMKNALFNDVMDMIWTNTFAFRMWQFFAQLGDIRRLKDILMRHGVLRSMRIFLRRLSE